MIWHVDQQAAVNGDGSEKRPFRWIQQAAEVAQPGDEVLVEPGIYREEVSPVYAGTREKPIVYRSRVPRGTSKPRSLVRRALKRAWRSAPTARVDS